MKILQLLPSLTSGGVEQVVLELSEGLVQKGHECIVVSAGGAMVADIENAGARHITMNVGKKSLRLPFVIRDLAKLIEQERPDVLHLHSRLPACVGHWALKKVPAEKRPKVVSTFHCRYAVNSYSAVMAKGDKVVAVSNFIQEHIQECYPTTPAEKIVVIPNSVDFSQHTPEYRPSDEWYEKWYAQYPELKGKYVICLPGRVARQKGADHLVPILTSLKERGIPAHAIIVGEVKKRKEAFRKRLVKKLEKAGLSDNVTWTGLRRDIRDVMVASDVVISLSLVPESFGKTVLEALALGRPTAGYESGGVGEQLAAYLPEGKVKTMDTDAMANVLAAWYQNPPKPRLPLSDEYSRESMINAHIALYKELSEQ